MEEEIWRDPNPDADKDQSTPLTVSPFGNKAPYTILVGIIDILLCLMNAHLLIRVLIILPSLSVNALTCTFIGIASFSHRGHFGCP